MKIIITNTVSTIVSAVAVFVLLASPLAAIAADYSGGYSTSGYETVNTSYYTPTYSGYDYGNSGGSSYTPSTPDKKPAPAPTCSLKANKNSIEKGESFMLTWSTKHAKKVTLNGNDVKDNGSRKVEDLTADKSWTLKVTGENGKTVTCKESINVKPKKEEPKPKDVCPNLSGNQKEVPNGYKLENGKCVKKSNPPAEEPKDICPNIPGVQKNLPQGHTFKDGKCVAIKTVINNNNTNVNQNNNVIIVKGSSDDDDHDHDNDDLSCRLDASRTSIQPGDTVRIEWESEDAERGYISHGIGWVDEDDVEDGSDTVRLYNTTTFIGTFYDEDNDWVRCSVTVYVQNYPGYYPPHTPFITLSSVPYTGLELGPVGTALYWSFLVLWCLVAAYLIAVKKVHNRIANRVKSFLFGSTELTTGGSTEPEVQPVQSVDMTTLTAMVQAIVNGQQTQKPTLRAAGHASHNVDTDEFILSQISRGSHGH